MELKEFLDYCDKSYTSSVSRALWCADEPGMVRNIALDFQEEKYFLPKRERLEAFFKIHFEIDKQYCFEAWDSFLENIDFNVREYNKTIGEAIYKYTEFDVKTATAILNPNEIHELVLSIQNRLSKLEENLHLLIEETVLQVLKKLSED